MFKRAIRAMMIGLVAMLGAKAEAHYVYFAGKYKYCSVCVDADFTQHNEGVNPNIRHTEEAEFVATIAKGKGEILCSDGIIYPSAGEVILRVRKPIVQGNTTQATLTDIDRITTTQVEAVLSDAAFNRFNVCPQFRKVDRLIREMSVNINTYAVCGNPNTCSSIPFDTFQVKCALSTAFVLDNYPISLRKECVIPVAMKVSQLKI